MLALTSRAIEGHGAATAARTGCVNASDDMDPTDTTTIDLPPGDINYQISDGTLTILTGDLAGTYE